MSVNEPLQAVVLQDENGNAVGVILDGSVYRLQSIGKILNASGAQINPATQETLASLDGKDFATETTLAARATAAAQTDGSQVAQSVGDVAHDAADSGAPVKVGGTATAALPTAVTEGDRVQASYDLQGRARSAATVVDPLPAGTNNIGDVDVVSSALPTGAATEATLATRATAAAQTDGTQKTQIVEGADTLDINASGQAAIQNPPNLDVALSTRATEATLVTADGRLTTIDAVLDSIKDTDGIKKITDPLPAGTNELGKVAQGTKGAAANGWPVVLYDASGNPLVSATGEPGAADRGYVVRPIETTRASYYAVFDRIAPAANKYMATLFNTSGTRKVVVQRVLRYAWRKASQAGNYDTTPEQYLARITARTAGTAVTIRSDDTGDTISSGISADTNSTAVTEAHIIRRFFAWLEPVDFADAAPGNWQPLAPEKNALVWERKFGTRGLTLRQNQGITIRNVTSVTQSDVSYVFEFTDEVA